jgi:hypothetical protein
VVDRRNEARDSGRKGVKAMKREAAAKDMAEGPRDTDAINEAAVFPLLAPRRESYLFNKLFTNSFAPKLNV